MVFTYQYNSGCWSRAIFIHDATYSIRKKEAAPLNISKKTYLLLISACGSFLAPFMVAGLVVALPSISRDLGMDAVTMGWTANAFFLAAAMLLIPMGRAADIFGVKRIFNWGLRLYFLSALLAGLAQTAAVLMGARFLTGVGAAMVFGTSYALLSLSLPEEERGLALGINMASNFTGFSFGFLAGGLFASYFTWRALFLCTLPIAMLGMVLVRYRLPGECALAGGSRLDIPGAGALSLAVMVMIVGLSGLPGPRGLILMASSILLLLLFVWQERSSTSPLVQVRLFWGNRPFALSNVSVLVFFSSTFAVIFLFSLYLQYIRGFDAPGAGLVLLAFNLAAVPLVIVSGRLSDRYNPRQVSLAGAAVTAAGLTLMAVMGPDSGMPHSMAALFLVLAGGAIFSPPAIKSVLGCLPREMYGLGSSMVEAMRLLGNAVSMAVTTMALAYYIGSQKIDPEKYPLFMQSMGLISVLFLLLCLGSLVLVAASGRRRRTEQTRGQ